MTSRRRRLLAIGSMLALAGSIAWLWSRQNASEGSLPSAPTPELVSFDAQPADRRDDPSQNRDPNHQPPIPAPRSPPQETSVLEPDLTPLPDATLPLAQTLPELEQAARAGSTRAACRIATGLLRCRMHVTVSGQMSAEQLASALERSVMQSQKDPAATELALGNAIEVLRLRELRSQEDSRFCADIGQSRLTETDRWLYLAASRGNLLAIDTLISGMLRASPDLLDNLDLLQRFRHDAPAMVESALHQGTGMIRVLAEAHAGSTRGIGWLEQVLEPDPVVAHALIKLEALEAMRNLRQGAPRAPHADFADSLSAIDPAGQARADALAEQWFAAREQHRLARQAAYARAGISPEERAKDPCLR